MDKMEARRQAKQMMRKHLSKMPHYKWGKDTYYIEQTYYADSNAAIRILMESGETWGMLSANIPMWAGLLKPGQFFAKTWSENEDWSKAALASGLFIDTGEGCLTGFVRAPIWQMNF